MTVYLDVLIALNLAVNYSLLSAVARLTGAVGSRWRLAVGAAVGAAYAGLTVMPGLGFLNGNLWRAVFLGLMAVTAFGVSRGTVTKGAMLLGFSFALGGMAQVLGLWGFWPLVSAAVIVALVCWLLFRGAMGHAGQLVPVTIALGGKQVRLTALRDSGNTLKDPFSGEPVMVVGGRSARTLLGPVDLRDPAGVMAQWTGDGQCRLIPYHALGGSGMLLAVRCDRVTVGGRSAGRLVAFSPETLSKEDTYQALTGGGQYG